MLFYPQNKGFDLEATKQQPIAFFAKYLLRAWNWTYIKLEANDMVVSGFCSNFIVFMCKCG